MSAMGRLPLLIAASVLAIGGVVPAAASDRHESAVVVQGEPQGGPRERARRMLERQDGQVELPGAPSTGAGEAREVRPSGSAPSSSGSQPRRGWSSGIVGGGFALATPLMWIVVGLAVLALVVAIVRSLGGRAPAGEAQRTKVRIDVLPTAAEAIADMRPDYVALAEAGRFGAAMHAMLREALRLLQERAGRLPLHATARGAVRYARRHSMPAEALDALVVDVERVHFGGADADADRYRQGLAALEQWRAVCRPKK